MKKSTFYPGLGNRTVSSLAPYLEPHDQYGVSDLDLAPVPEHFQPSIGVQFNEGDIFHEERAQEVPAGTLDNAVDRLESELSKLEKRLGCHPSSEDVATSMGLELEEYFRMLEKIHLLPSLFCFPWKDLEDDPVLDTVKSNGALSSHNARLAGQVERLARAIDDLSEKERIVITLCYWEELNFREVAAVLDLAESKIHQLHSQAMIRLRAKMRQGCAAKDCPLRSISFYSSTVKRGP